MQQIEIEFESPVTNSELTSIELFRFRFSELWKNWDSLEAQGISLGGNFKNPERGRITGTSCGIERHRLKGLYVDYRFFHGNGEPTNYFYIANIVGKRCKDERLQELLKRNKLSWRLASPLSGWHGYSADKLIDTLFNAQIFHSDTSKHKQNLDILTEAVESDVFHHELTLCIYQRMLVIRNLNWVLLPLNSTNRTRIRLPSQ